jgi:putative PIN family toxin of toxin-antitoxin system
MVPKVAPLVVIDTNVMVSSLLFGGHLTFLHELWSQRLIVPLLSKETFSEFRRVLSYPKFSLTAEEIRAIIDDEILPFFEVVEVELTGETFCRDPDDDKFLAVAAAGNANWLITGDRDLLDMGSYGTIMIVTPRQYREHA